MSDVITKTQVVATLQSLVRQHGANTIRSNTYVNERLGVPNCIAGCAFSAWGVSLSALIAVEGVCVDEIALDWPLDGVELTEAAEDVLCTAQNRQDDGATWGHVLELAMDKAVEWGDVE